MLEAKETEIRDEAFQIVREANRFHPSWGRLIFENANQISSNLNHRDILLNISKQRTDEQAKMRQMGMNVPELKFNIKPVAAPTSECCSIPSCPSDYHHCNRTESMPILQEYVRA